MISVIVPAYNVEKTIKRTLDSILKQTYSELEVVVIDDGSTDHTGKIIDWYQKNIRKKSEFSMFRMKELLLHV